MTTFGLIGRGIGHSRSPLLFNERFARLGIEAEYNLYELEKGDLLPGLVASLPELKGLNVTSPWKEAVVPFMDELTAEAQGVGAVNTIGVERREGFVGKAGLEGIRLIGHNTDVVGFRESLLPLLPSPLVPRPSSPSASLPSPLVPRPSSLILGTGGAAKAVLVALKQLGIEARLVSRSRNTVLAPQEASRPGANRENCPEASRESYPEVLAYDDLTPELIAGVDIIINATPVGMGEKADQKPQLPYEAIGPQHLCYDLIYSPEETLFMKRCAEQDARVSNGREMHRLQADASWLFWSSL